MIWKKIKKYWFEILLIIAGIWFIKCYWAHNGKGENKYDEKTKKYIKKINELDGQLKELDKTKVTKKDFKNVSRADNISAIRKRIKRWKDKF